MSGSSTSIRLDYFPYLTSSMFNILKNPPNNDIDRAADYILEMLDSYGLSKDDLTENLKDLKVLFYSYVYVYMYVTIMLYVLFVVRWMERVFGKILAPK